MIKSILNKVFSFSLALLVLVSTISFTIEKHYCGNVLVDVSIFLEAKKCGFETTASPQKKSCCKDEIDVVKGQDELKVSSFEDFDFEQQWFLIACKYYYKNDFEIFLKQIIPHKHYTPPNLTFDLQVLDQVFII